MCLFCTENWLEPKIKVSNAKVLDTHSTKIFRFYFLSKKVKIKFSLFNFHWMSSIAKDAKQIWEIKKSFLLFMTFWKGLQSGQKLCEKIRIVRQDSCPSLFVRVEILKNLSPSKRLNIKLYYILYANNLNWWYEDRNLLFQPSNNQNWGYKDRN